MGGDDAWAVRTAGGMQDCSGTTEGRVDGIDEGSPFLDFRFIFGLYFWFSEGEEGGEGRSSCQKCRCLGESGGVFGGRGLR